MKTYRSCYWTTPHTRIQLSPTAGHGLFAVAPIRKGEIIEIMGGVAMGEEEFQAFQRASSRSNQAYNAIQIGEALHLVELPAITATRQGSINHSCDSNLWLADEVTFVARRDIAAGEEITLDYALCTAQTDWVLDSICCCGAVSCRSVITGEDWKRPDVQTRYHGHFSPFLNARIAKAC